MNKFAVLRTVGLAIMAVAVSKSEPSRAAASGFTAVAQNPAEATCFSNSWHVRRPLSVAGR
jgi:hypothetical protein